MKLATLLAVLSLASTYSLLSALGVSASAINSRSAWTAARFRYTRAHTLGDGYVFDSRDGWTSLNVTDMAYKYESRSNVPDIREAPNEEGTQFEPTSAITLHSRSSKKSKSKATKKKQQSFSGGGIVQGLGDVISGTIETISKLLRPIGKPEPVVITWYTGHDLLNPSCWSQSVWAPTDASFAAALTLEGWTTKPQCFKFLELCSSSKKCVFVRVIDTCAGCAKGSKHVDLTRAAFGALADFDVGLLTVQMRGATDPNEHWFEDLWGPKVKSK